MSRRDLTSEFQLYPKNAKILGWVETSGAGAWTIDAHYNVSSITDNGAGDFTINWLNAFSNANYVVIGMAIGASGGGVALDVFEGTATAKSATVVRVVVINSADGVTATDPTTGISVVAIGRE